jgi:hypothetical protein
MDFVPTKACGIGSVVVVLSLEQDRIVKNNSENNIRIFLSFEKVRLIKC